LLQSSRRFSRRRRIKAPRQIKLDAPDKNPRIDAEPRTERSGVSGSASRGFIRLLRFAACGEGSDFLSGGIGNVWLKAFGSDRDPTVVDILIGDEGHDSLYAGYGKDQLDGGIGHDFLSGGTGNDKLTGGEGNDKFIMQPSNLPTITDLTSEDFVLWMAY